MSQACTPKYKSRAIRDLLLCRARGLLSLQEHPTPRATYALIQMPRSPHSRPQGSPPSRRLALSSYLCSPTREQSAGVARQPVHRRRVCSCASSSSHLPRGVPQPPSEGSRLHSISSHERGVKWRARRHTLPGHARDPVGKGNGHAVRGMVSSGGLNGGPSPYMHPS